MDIRQTAIDGVKLVVPKRFGDNRGFFVETYKRAAFLDAGIDADFCQDNHSMSADVGTVRGLHFQTPPFAQAKLVRVVRGRILDVAVDVRSGSPTYGKHAAVELSADNGWQLFIPPGFAHGFCTLEPNSEITYKVSAPYAPNNDAGILWSDPDLKIAWPVSVDAAVLSDKDRAQPRLKNILAPFVFVPAHS